MTTLEVIVLFAFLFIVFGGGYYGYYGRRNPTPTTQYGYAPGIGGILITLLVIWFVFRYVFHVL